MTPEIHPLANLIPTMDEAAYVELREDIIDNGLRQPIILFEGKVLDGRHRLRACQETGSAVLFDKYDGDSPAAHVISLNLHRRHLSVSQRAMIVTDFLPHLEAEARRRSGRRTDLLSTSVSKETEVAGRSRERAGAMVGVSHAVVGRAKRVSEADPGLAQQVRNGALTVGAAHEIVKGRQMPKETPVATPSTERQIDLANAAKRRIEAVIGTCQSFTALKELRVQNAVAVSSSEEVAAWEACVTDALRSLRDFRSQIQTARSGHATA